MPNSIKYNTSATTNTIRSGNFHLGINEVDYGPTETTGFWNTIEPPLSGYTVYLNKVSQGPSIYVANNDQELIDLVKSLGGTNINTVVDALSWVNSNNDMIVTNKNYENIVTDGLVLNLDAGFSASYPKGNTLWSDISGSGNNGTLINGPTFNSSNGGSIVFDGVSDKVECLTAATLDIQSKMTIEVMMYPNVSNQNGAVLSKWTTGGGTNNSYALTLGQDASNNKYGFYIYQSNNVLRSLLSTFTYSGNVWVHIVCTADGSTLKIYKNGISDSSTQSYNGTIKSTTKKVVIASLREEDSLYNYNGRIGFSRIYNRNLSEQEILQNYNATKSRFGL